MESLQDQITQVRRSWGWILAYGILLIVVGWIAAFHPIATNVAVGFMLGIGMIFVGAASLLAAFRDFGWQAKLVDVLFGVLSLVGAFLFIAMPVLSATSLVWAVGIFFIVNGGFEIYHSFKVSEDKGLLVLMGIIDLVLGIYLSTFMPIGGQILALAWFVGLGFIARGVILAILAFKVRSTTRQILPD